MKSFATLSFLILFLFFDKDIQKTVYPKWQIWAYQNDSDLKKDSKTVNAKDKKLVDLGQKLNAIKEKKDGDKTYYQVQLPDTTKYWVNAGEVTEKYITINSSDVVTYSQPDNSPGYINNDFKLQPGDFGYFVKEQAGFINVDFISYMPRGNDKKVVWVGNVWINGGYTDDVKYAKEAFYIAYAYNQIYAKTPNIDNAKYYLKKAMSANGDDKTELVSVAQQVLDGLK